MVSESNVPSFGESSEAPAGHQQRGRDQRGESTGPKHDQEQFAAATEQVDAVAALREAQERALRARAELENYRKRMQNDMAKQRKYAELPLVRDLLPVLDGLDRAMETVNASASAAELLQGVKMVAEELRSVLKQHDCQRIDAEGQPFDPSLHEAIAQVPSEDKPKGTIIHVAKAGYRLHERVIRPSQVIVSTGAGGKSDEVSAEQICAKGNQQTGQQD